MLHLILKVWKSYADLDLQGARFALLYDQLVLQDGEAWEFARNFLPKTELDELCKYAERQIQTPPAIATTDLPFYSTSGSWLTDLSQNEEQSRRRHTLARLQQL